MENENLSNIWPILYFKADWPAESYKFDFDVSLIKATEEMLEKVGDVTTGAWASNNSAMCNFYQNTEWFLALPSPKPTEHVSPIKIGISFEHRLQKAIVDSFLLCLKLIHQTAAICPLEIGNVELEGEVIDPDSLHYELDDMNLFYGVNTDEPPVLMPESFQLGDLQLLSDLWSTIIELRNLKQWSTWIYDEVFWADCDRKSGEEVVKKLVDAAMSNPACSEFSKEERKQYKKQWTATFRALLVKGDNIVNDLYQKSLEKVFLEKQDNAFSNRTRIGRALNLFSEGLHLPILNSFLSMCLVLETIFTVEDTEITYQFSTRLANMTGKNLEDKKDIFERARNVYKARSNIVHGRKSIEAIETNILKDAFSFARKSIRHIIRDDKLMKLYSDPITSDEMTDTKKPITAIKDYFRDLDLR